EAFLAAQIAEGADVGQAEREADLVLIRADSAQGKAAIFHADADAAPVIAGLRGSILQPGEVGIPADAAGKADAALVGMAVAGEGAELVEDVRAGNGIGDKDLARRVKKGMTAANKEIAQAPGGED